MVRFDRIHVVQVLCVLFVLHVPAVVVIGVGAGLARAGEPADFVGEPDWIIEKVAGPPLVEYPLFACFDDQGRLYVAEGTGLNVAGSELIDKKLGRITRLEDADGDGRFDTSVVFAGGLVFPQGVLWHDGVVYTASHPNIWQLRDLDGDGRADQREALVGAFGFNGNGCDIHGPFLGPDGWLYWTDGRHGHDIRCPEGHELKGLAARIFRCRVDGTQIERIAGGGFDNPVELIFTPEGDIIGTMDQGAGDRLLHYVEGGVYPSVDHPCVEELVQTGPPLSSVSEFSAALPVALCGLERIRSPHFGPQHQGTLLTAQFNVHRIQQHHLSRSGATFRSRDVDFLQTFNHDVHPSEILEDADGSLLMIDMGAWFNYGCPTSKIAKPFIKGSIYRIRHRGATKVDDPWGRSIDWERLSPEALVRLLGDPRPRVRDRASARAGRGNDHEIQTLIEAYAAHAAPQPVAVQSGTASSGITATEVRQNILWALIRTDHASARSALRGALADPDPAVRQVALHGVGLGRDPRALPALTGIVVSDTPPLRLKAAEALGRIGDSQAVPALVESIRAGTSDRFLEHALIYALVVIGDPAVTLASLTDTNPRVRRATLIALDQMQGENLTRELVAPLLDTDDPDLQKTVIDVISRHAGWADQISGYIEQWLSSDQGGDVHSESLAGALLAFCDDGRIQQLVADAVMRPEAPLEKRMLLLEVMARCRLETLPESWLLALRHALAEAQPILRRQAIEAVRSRGMISFDEPLLVISRDATLPADTRIAALECLGARQGPLSGDAFQLLADHLDDRTEPLLRAAAARTLAAGRLSDEQLLRLAKALQDAGPLLVPLLVSAYTSSGTGEVGMALIDALAHSSGADALTADDLGRLLQSYPDEVHAAAEPLLRNLTARREEQAAYLAKVKLQLLRTKGDPDRGREVFFSQQAACSGCHTIDGRGGSVGPELSKIGQIRSAVDLVEAVVFPSSSIALGYSSYTIATSDGQLHTGVIVRETSDAVYLRTAQLAEIRIPRQQVEDMRQAGVSIMPEGLEKSLDPQQLSDLLEFLFHCR